ncbi:MAG: hypothetical protein ABTQ34_08085 [Bdellovibrionales bacterium]
MLEAVALNRVFYFLPTIDFGKFWSFFRVTKSTRPLTAQECSNRFHDVTWDGTTPVRPDDLIGGAVYVTAEGKAIHWDEAADKYAFEARYLKKTPAELFPKGRKSHAVAFDDTREVGDIISAEDREGMLSDYHGEENVAEILASVRKLSGPFRPIPTEWRSKPLAWLVQDDKHVPGYGEWAGVVYTSEDGNKLMFTPFGTNGKPYLGSTHYLNLNPLDYVETARRIKPSAEKTPNFAGYYSEVGKRRDSLAIPKDRAWVERCLKSEGGAPAPAKDFTLG